MFSEFVLIDKGVGMRSHLVFFHQQGDRAWVLIGKDYLIFRKKVTLCCLEI